MSITRWPASFVFRCCRCVRQTLFSSVSCTKLFGSLELPTVDDVPEVPHMPLRCTCRSEWCQYALKHGLVTLLSDHGISSSKDACLVLLKCPPVHGVLESNAVSQHSVEETDAYAEAFAGQICLMFIPLERSVLLFTEQGNCGICIGLTHLGK